ncbi:TraB/GumN family protein [Mucilaginibacter sp. UYCu711]|uniref:TraB/GumN family protein n=1 Tax=Mucilaginibacter sp. UYCu711 TaxID=3156339 RepID=UPI003D21B88D
MRKLILLILTAALGLTTVNAQTKKYNSLLWEVTGNGLKAPSYLFGTYHFASKKLVDSLSDIKKYFNACKMVAGEAIMDSTAMGNVFTAMTLPDDTTLDKLYTPEEYKIVSDYVTGVSPMTMEMLTHFKPAAVQLMLLGFTMPKTFSDTNPAIDVYFQQEGKRLGDKVMGFETLKEQGDMIFGTPMNEQKKNLLESIRKKDEAKKDGEKLYALYLKQDLDGIDKMINDALVKEKKPELSDKMLKDRNLRWIIKIPAIISEQQTFIAVGAAHLVGQYGLINQLRLKGYTVKAVKI